MWVADYILVTRSTPTRCRTKTHDSSKDFYTWSAANADPHGIWSDGTTMWVANSIITSSGDKIYAYKMSDKIARLIQGL